MVGVVVLVGDVRRGGQLVVPPVINGRLRVEVVGCVVQVLRVVMMNYLLLMLLLLLILMLLLLLLLLLILMLLLLLLL